MYDNDNDLDINEIFEQEAREIEEFRKEMENEEEANNEKTINSMIAFESIKTCEIGRAHV